MLFAKGQVFVANNSITIVAVAAYQEHWYRLGPRYKVKCGSKVFWISEIVLCQLLEEYVQVISPVDSITLDLKIG